MTWTCAPLLCLALIGQAGVAPPRYRLEVGQKLEFAGHDAQRANGVAGATAWGMTCWVIDRAEPNGWRVLVEVRSSRLMHRWKATPDGSLPASPPLKAQGATWDDLLGRIADEGRQGSGAKSSELAVVTLRDDGRVEGDEMTLEGLLDGRVGDAFPRLDESSGKLAPEGDGLLVSSKSSRARTDEVPDIERTTRRRFDPARGLMVESARDGTSATHPAYRLEGRVELRGAEAVELAWLDRARPEADRFVEAQGKVNAVENLIGGDAQGNIRAAIEAMDRAIDRAKQGSTLPTFAPHLKDLATRGAELVAYQGERDAKVKALVGSAAPDWKAKDLDGREWDARSLRGKVVVVDFWYRVCGWCIKAMPQVKDLAGRFGGRPVQFLGMNTDRDPDDARHVAEVQKLNYPTLLVEGTDLADQLGASTLGFPTTVVIDRKGVIREVIVGYSDDLAETLSGVLDRLLNED